MEKLIALQKKIAPELAAVIEHRYILLRNIYFIQPIGRRTLADRLREPERYVRRELDFLRDQGLITAAAGGVSVTPDGEALLWELKDYISQLRGLSDLEGLLAAKLNLEKAVVVPGDSDQDETVKNEIGRAAAKLLKEVLADGNVLAVTGGTTMADVAGALAGVFVRRNVTVVPARGGLGEEVEIQSNTIAAKIAKGLDGAYRLLHVPDDLGDEAIAAVSNEPKIREILALLKRADVLLHGIGTAEEMASRRGMDDKEIAALRQKEAVGEAFGYYFNRRGDCVYASSSVGIQLEDLANIPLVIAVGGGSSKAEPVLAVMSNRYQNMLVTDEGAAREILKIKERSLKINRN